MSISSFIFSGTGYDLSNGAYSSEPGAIIGFKYGSAPMFIKGNLGTFRARCTGIDIGWKCHYEYQIVPNWNYVNRVMWSLNLAAKNTDLVRLAGSSSMSAGSASGSGIQSFSSGNIFTATYNMSLVVWIYVKLPYPWNEGKPFNLKDSWEWTGDQSTNLNAWYGYNFSDSSSIYVDWIDPVISAGTYKSSTLYETLANYIPQGTNRTCWSVLPKGLKYSDVSALNYSGYDRIYYTENSDHPYASSGYYYNIYHQANGSGVSTGKIIISAVDSSDSITVVKGSSEYVTLKAGLIFSISSSNEK